MIPFDLTELRVWLGDKRYADAKPLEVGHLRSRNALDETKAPEPEKPVEVGISFMDLAERKRQAAWAEQEVRYARE